MTVLPEGANATATALEANSKFNVTMSPVDSCSFHSRFFLPLRRGKFLKCKNNVGDSGWKTVDRLEPAGRRK